VRLALREGAFTKLGGGGGIVEVDESWIGGAARLMNAKQRKRAMKPDTKQATNRGKRSFSGKAIVLGMLERGKHGRIRVRHVTDVKRRTLEPHIHEHVAGGSDIHTDAHTAYQRLDWGDINSP